MVTIFNALIGVYCLFLLFRNSYLFGIPVLGRNIDTLATLGLFDQPIALDLHTIYLSLSNLFFHVTTRYFFSTFSISVPSAFLVFVSFFFISW